jgi:tight adherence protein B
MPQLLWIFAALTLAYLTWTALLRVAVDGPAPDASAPRWRLPWAEAVLLPLGLALALGWALGSIWMGLLVLVAAPAWPRLRQAQAQRRLRQELAGQMPAFLEALSGGLRAGLSLPQALDAAVEDLPEPSADVARRLLAGLRLGESPDALMLAEAQRFGRHPLAADWRLLATAVAIQRSSGGDLAAILDQLTGTLRERQRLQAQIDALTAQGRLSAWVVGLLPGVLLLALHLMDPELVAPLFSTTTGWVLLGLGALLEAAGVLLLMRIVDIEA